MPTRIIDNKKLEITNDEYRAYQELCKAYDRDNFKGEELFKDHFEVNEHGIIIFVKPPSQRYSSLEVFCFLLSIMQNQHIRIMYEQNKSLMKESAQHIKKLRDELDELKEDLKSAQTDVEKG